MNDATQRRFGRIVNFVYFAIFLGFAYLFMKYCFGIVFPFIFAFFIAMIVQKPTNLIYNKIHRFKGITSTIFVLLLLIIGVSLVSLLGAKIVGTCRDFVTYLIKKIADFPTFIGNVEKWALNVIAILPDSLESKLQVSITNGLESFKKLTASEAAGLLVKYASNNDKVDLASLVSPIGGGVWSVVKEIPSVLIATLISVIASCFMASDYDRLVGFLKRQIKPRYSEALSKSKAILFSTLKQLLKAYGTIMLITFSELALGLYVLKFLKIYNSEYIILIAAITAIVDIVPVLGTGTVLLPWVVYSFLNGNLSFAIGLLVIYVVVLIIRQIIEPKLVADRLGLPPVITIAAMYIGTQLFGMIGLFLLPITLIMLKRLNDEGVLHLWKTGAEKAETAAEANDEADVEPAADGIVEKVTETPASEKE